METNLNRRDIFKVFTAAALAGPLAIAAPQPGAPLFFTKDEFAALDALTNLIIPTLNDDDSEFKELCDWVLNNLGDDVPGRRHDGRNAALARNEIPQPRPDGHRRRRISRAMAQQRSDVGNDAAPQKFIRLVGYRDSRRARRGTADSPTLAPRS